jgi:hypothetical protein
MPIFPDNFAANSLSGTVLITDGHANLNLTTNPYALEGNKSFVIKLRKGGPTGLVIATSSPITLRDSSSIISLTANVSSVNEGNLVQFTLVTANAVDNSNVYYSVFPATANITRQDFFGANTGMATIVSNQATFALRANADLSLMDETGENFRVQLRTNSPVGNIIYSTSNVEILDVSKGFNILSFVENNSTVAEGGTLTLTFNATNIPVGTVFHYFTEGNATTSTFTGGNTGSFVMNGLSNTVTLLPTGVPYSTTQNFNVKLRALSNTGVVVATSNNIIAIDSALAYINATGGTITDSGGYRIHAFTTSGNLTISSLGIGSGNLTDYLVIAAGGGGGSHFGGGGGAGGFLSSNTTISSIGNLLVTVGAGGGGYSRGSNSSMGIVVASGGGGGGGGGGPGGSGGGGGLSDAFPGGLGTTGQGFPGGFTTVTPSSTSRGGAGGGGASQAGEPGPVSLDRGGNAGNGSPSSWVTPSYGTPGPAPGRWFSGGGGGGAGGAPGTFGLGGAGGGGRGGGVGAPDSTASPGFAGTIYTGGGGGGSGGPIAWGSVGGTGGSGIVIVRYPYVPPPTISNVLTTANVFLVGSNITFTVNAQNANLTTLYYSTDGNVDSSYFIGGNTGSFVANASGGIVTLQSNTNIPLDESRQFRLQIRQDSTTGFISGSSANVTIENPRTLRAVSTAGNIITDTNYVTHVFTSSGTFAVTVASTDSANATMEILVVGGGGCSFGGANNSQGRAGAGAGGYIARSNVATVTTYNVIVGAGGASGSPGVAANSSFIGGSGSANINYISVGGGQAGGNSGTFRNGGSGGGTDGFGGTAGQGWGWPGPNQQGNPGGGGIGGGGGAGAAGAPNGNGGIGEVAPMSSSLGTSYGTTGPAPGRYFAGGGAGIGGNGGAGGGGNVFTAGIVNTGGGAGANTPGQGGSGIVIIRYPR